MTPPGPAAQNTRSNPPYSTPVGATLWAKGLLVTSLALAVVAAVSGLFQMELISRAGTTGITAVEAAANDSRQQVIGLLQIGLWLGTGVAFLIWLHHAHRNLPALGGRRLKYTPGWAVGWFFVPFLNLVRPLQVMTEVWHGSDPGGLERDEGPDGPVLRNQLGAPALVSAWWGLFLASNLLGNFAARMALTPNQTLDQIQFMSGLMVLSDALDIPGALVAIGLITRVTSMQGERSDRVGHRGVEAPAASADNPARVG